MDIYLNNTLTRKKEKFVPIKKEEVGIYSCGPTVYFFPHIGNMRAYVFADVLRRSLEYSGLKVKQVINITDVGHLTSNQDSGEDKIEQTAKKEGKTAGEITKFYEEAFYKDLADLNIEIKDTKFPRATEHIVEQIEIIKILEEKGFAYKISDGIYFDTSKFKDYGKLGNINLKEQKEGARVEINNEKKNPTDFALWKFSKPEEKRLQEWPSPWGTGFPGWHIECSAMSRKYLGQPFDIHTGGIDHIPVHHNNEIAQSECAFSVPLANFWLHNEFLTVEGEKMSKSLGNIFTISDLKERGVHPLSFRYWLLTSHYRSPANFTWESVFGAQTAFEKIIVKYSDWVETEYVEGALNDSDVKQFEEAIADDLNTPIVIAILQKVSGGAVVNKMDKILGLNIKVLAEQLRDIPDEISKLQEERDNVRADKDWKKSDEIRGTIEQKGYTVFDSSDKSVILKTLSLLAKERN
ncbi:MAG: cysteine--tRNA ligase [Candidatus Zambryskibacteria bacterium RIFCSPHIGHO2_12_FULL_38_34]|uniref:Cysteine--tRNA ligase n=1 Tax=Candidatus Zambryskibacteria bacterium RIFCSPLOWO2_12_FULL_39_16 TaxID=1802775 RepID=A0A1G2URM1_9BACT|nr:MAG: cysteine--tRNA ligase [Candidatus Zambryskibacteria bacterium RIFCSPHIGHO2_02_FULL_38_22]OHA98574.1 MAG: cysteine--tRNA ligase [Candidatus Zambryskibacteria bacterium RIFCSPHIGHO2_12_FULL_38_34]OHB12037.1 MAG: cysteine--tRNA ligase [Candidatus Zambryskibacteria bacterium RIFCSPLOWO2_12_FULL_39_16]